MNQTPIVTSATASTSSTLSTIPIEPLPPIKPIEIMLRSLPQHPRPLPIIFPAGRPIPVVPRRNRRRRRNQPALPHILRLVVEASPILRGGTARVRIRARARIQTRVRILAFVAVRIEIFTRPQPLHLPLLLLLRLFLFCPKLMQYLRELTPPLSLSLSLRVFWFQLQSYEEVVVLLFSN